MIKWIITFGWGITILISLNAQIPSPPKYKTQVKESSRLKEKSEQKGVKLIALKSNDCDHNSTWDVINRLQNRIIENSQKEDTLTLRIATVAECCRDFMGEVELKNGDTLNLIYTPYGRACDCNCCFELEYKIVTKMNKDFKYQLNDKPIFLTHERYKTTPVQFEILMGDTINLVDKYGMRQGYWKQKNEKGQITLEGYYFNRKDDYYDNWLTGFTGRWSIEYFENGHIKREDFRINGRDLSVFRVYYPNGKIQQECMFSIGFDEDKCQKWDEKGVLIKKQE